MASKPTIAVVVDWYGPYPSLEAAHDAAADWEWPGLYMAVRRGGALLYVGVSEDLSGRLLESQHHKLKDPQNYDMWLGEVASAGVSGKRLTAARETTIEAAESAHAYFLQPKDNDKKTVYAPRRLVTVVNRWWSTDIDDPSRLPSPHRDWPDVIDYNDDEEETASASLHWYDRERTKLFGPDDFWE